MRKTYKLVLGSALCIGTILAGTFSLIVSSASAQNATPPPNVTLPQTKPQDTDEVTETAGGLKFTISVPSEFTEKVHSNRKNGASNMESIIWAPPFSKGESTRATLAVTVNDGFANMSQSVRTTEFVDAFLSSYPLSYQDFKKTPSKEVVINGRKFGTASWEGHKTKLGPGLVHGFIYVTLVGTKAVAVDSRDPTAAQSFLSKADNAARTIKVE